MIDQSKVLREIFENAPIGVWLLDADGRMRFVNRAYCEAVGIPEERLLAAPNAWALFDDETAARCLASDRAALENDGPHTSRERLALKDGTIREFEVFRFRILGGGGAAAALVGLNFDVGERHGIAGRHRLSVFDHAHQGIVITDADGTILDVNPSFTRITGYAREEVLGRNPRILNSGRHHPDFYREMWAALASTGHWSNEIWNRRKDGSVYPEWLGITAFPGEDGKAGGYVAIFSDISTVKRRQEELQRLAHHDPLTGLPNRLLLADRMAQAIALTQRTGALLAVGYLDLDFFKTVNDRFGHGGGDALLAEIARRLLDTVRSGDTVARLGGDEFVLLLPDQASLDNCLAVFRRVLEKAIEPVTLPGQTESVSVTASLGVSLFPLDAGDPYELLGRADQAMYRAKSEGRNRIQLFRESRRAEDRFGGERLSRLRAALTSGEFELHYQPVINMRTGQLVAAEALARWRHPERGLLGPAEFLDDIEASRLEEQFGDWVVHSALEQLAAWSGSGAPAKVSINITAQNLLNAGFCRRLANALAARPSVVRERLQLEVVETTALADLRRAREVFEACHELGVSLAIDDFGTGYSSLSYLSRLPAELIKIDKSFVLGMLSDPGDLVIVDGIIALAKAFGLSVVAEGVETTEQGLALLRLGCEQAQGFGIARPMPAKEIAHWLRDRLPNPAWQEYSRVGPPQVDFPLFAAEQWHREWFAQLAAAARAPEREPLPELAVEACQVGVWFSGAGRQRLGGLPAFADLERSHAAMHRLGQQLAETLRGGDDTETARLMASLEVGRDDFLAKLRKLQREVSASRLRP